MRKNLNLKQKTNCKNDKRFAFINESKSLCYLNEGYNNHETLKGAIHLYDQHLKPLTITLLLFMP